MTEQKIRFIAKGLNYFCGMTLIERKEKEIESMRGQRKNKLGVFNREKDRKRKIE